MKFEDMVALRTAAWNLLVPFTTATEGLPTSPQWTSVTGLEPSPPLDGKPLFPPKSKLDLRTAADKPILYEAAFLDEAAWRFAVKLETKDQLQARFVRELQLPPKSKAVKMFFYRIRGTEEVPVQLWDWTKVKARDLTYLNPASLGEPQCVKLRAELPRCIAAEGNFYTVRVTESDKRLFTCASTCAFDLAKDDVMILVGMHIVSKDTPEWLWSTFWWRGALQERFHGDYWTCQDAQQPDSLRNVAPWNRYSMDVTVSFQLLKPEPRPHTPTTHDAACGLPPALGDDDTPDPANQNYLATYNPFVEAGMANGLKSNCVNCHARATTMNASGAPPTPRLQDTTSPAVRDFEGHIRLDYLWSLRRRLDPTGWPPQD
jgi:hypothetical protein